MPDVRTGTVTVERVTHPSGHQNMVYRNREGRSILQTTVTESGVEVLWIRTSIAAMAQIELTPDMRAALLALATDLKEAKV
jgi:hypothetical protein